MALISIFIVFLIIILTLLILKVRSRLILNWDRSYTCLVGKTAIITGANAGIGYYTALEFAKRGGRVILACRSKERAEKSRKKIVSITGNPNVIVKLYDASSFDSIRAFAKDINENEQRLDILVNNAGATLSGHKLSKDGNNLVMQVNYFSGFLLTHLLIDKLKASAPSRVINVSSIMHQFGTLDPNNLNKYSEPPFWLPNHNGYSNSKLGNICFTLELAKRLEGTGVTTNCLHPGAVTTEIWRNVRGVLKALYSTFAPIVFRTSEEGAQTTIYLSVSPDVENISGIYFDNCKMKRIKLSMKNPHDVEFVRKVWEETEKIVKLSPEEKIYAPTK